MTQEQIPILELVYRTWGSFGQFEKLIAILKNGEIIDPENYVNTRRGAVIVKDDVRIENRSSSRNTYIHVYVSKEKVLAVIREVKTASNHKFIVVEGSGEVRQEENVEERIVGKFKYITTIIRYVYVYDDVRVTIRENRIANKEKVSLRIEMRKNENVYELTGDTFEVKELIKSHNGKWDAKRKVWIVSELDIDSLVENLKTRGVEVVIT